jgi:hypothetical protein
LVDSNSSQLKISLNKQNWYCSFHVEPTIAAHDGPQPPVPGSCSSASLPPTAHRAHVMSLHAAAAGTAAPRRSPGALPPLAPERLPLEPHAVTRSPPPPPFSLVCPSRPPVSPFSSPASARIHRAKPSSSSVLSTPPHPHPSVPLPLPTHSDLILPFPNTGGRLPSSDCTKLAGAPPLLTAPGDSRLRTCFSCSPRLWCIAHLPHLLIICRTH